MAARKIETTISLDGEQQFKSALSAATREMRVMESELRAVSAAYESNGNAAQFYAAKQQNLRNQIAQQREIVQSLERAVEDAGKAYGQNSAQVDAYAIKLNNARTRLSRLEQQLSETDSEMEELGRDALRAGRQLEDGIGDGADSARSSLESLISTMQQDISSIQTSTAFTAVTGLWDMATGAYNAVAGFVEGTVDYRRQLSFLKQNAETSGFDFDDIKAELVEVTALTGDSSAAIEGLSNLLAAGVDKRQLEASIDTLAGAVVSFPDTMKFESLADSLQETIATGSATGQFGELLGRLGVDIEAFNTALTESESAAGDLDIALAYLAANGMTQVYQQWQQTNEAMNNAAQTQAELEMELAEFGGTLEKYITTPIKQQVVEALAYVNDVIETAETQGTEAAGQKIASDINVAASEAMTDVVVAAAESEAKMTALQAGLAFFAEGGFSDPWRGLAGALGETGWIEQFGAMLSQQQDLQHEAERFVQQQVMDGINGAEMPDLSIIGTAGAESAEAGKKAGIQYGQNFADATKSYMQNEFPRLPNPLEDISPAQTMIDHLGVGAEWKKQLDAIGETTRETKGTFQAAGESAGAAMASGFESSTADMSLFPEQIVIDTENAIPAMSAAGEEAGAEAATKFGESFGEAYMDFVNNEFPQLPNPLDNISPAQTMIDQMGVADEWKTMLDSISSTAESASAGMAETGASMGANFADGVRSSEGDVLQAAESLSAAAEDGASSASGSGAYAAGSNIGAQLAAGLLSQVGYVSSASSRLGAAATAGIGSGGVRTGWGGSGGSSVINTVLNIDGRSFASATASYISSALAVRAMG